MTDRMMKRITVFDAERWDSKDWPPKDSGGFIGWFQAKVATVPVAFRASAEIEIKSVGGYEGEHNASLEITYERPETDDEIQRRIDDDQARRTMREIQERRTLAELKAKYGQ